MQMRDEDGVDVRQPVAARNGLDASKRADARPGHRVGDDANAVKVDRDGRMAEEREVEPRRHRQVLRAASGYSRTRRYGSRPRDRETRLARSAIWCWSRRM